jgi:hypothetical protein
MDGGATEAGPRVAWYALPSIAPVRTALPI